MTPRPHGSESPKPEVAARVWMLEGMDDEEYILSGPDLEDGERVRVVEAPVSPPKEPEQELTFHDDDRWEPDPAHARVEELGAALREAVYRLEQAGHDLDYLARRAAVPGEERTLLVYAERTRAATDEARRALRGSVPAGEDDDV